MRWRRRGVVAARGVVLDVCCAGESPGVGGFAKPWACWVHLAELGGGRAIRWRRRRRTAVLSVQRGKGERETGDGKTINRLKFKINSVNSILLPLNGLKQKTFEYYFCSVFRDLQLLFQALFHLSNGL